MAKTVAHKFVTGALGLYFGIERHEFGMGRRRKVPPLLEHLRDLVRFLVQGCLL
ncbi:hypothetical protein [Falsihalocynthiibacter arcticus]|uniref:hypothetical protein n=1 Tax=Falsihalocynthiibacter arcticus TaxID=1579316 RepID=UPI0012E8F4F2|nr:hypothetical protein [Falsihalocynthiibacter arcticus]